MASCHSEALNEALDAIEDLLGWDGGAKVSLTDLDSPSSWEARKAAATILLSYRADRWHFNGAQLYRLSAGEVTQ